MLLPGKYLLAHSDRKMSNIIFDFDGTIADSLPIVMELFFDWSGIEPLSKKEIEKVRNMHTKDIFGYFGISIWKAPSLLVKGRSELGKRLDDVLIFGGIEDVLKQLSKQGHTLYVVSSNSTLNIRRFLRKNKISKYFSGVHGNVGIFGKTNVLRTIIRKYHLNPAECFSIGDETRDIDAAKKLKITSVAAGWGYNGEKILREHRPDFFAAKPKEIITIIASP